MAIEREEIELGSVVPYERTKSYSVEWPFGEPLPSLDALREKYLLRNGIPISKIPERVGRAVNVAGLLNKQYTYNGKTITGMEYMEFTKIILDTECAEFFG